MSGEQIPPGYEEPIAGRRTPALVLDTNHIEHDWHWRGATSRLLRFMSEHHLVTVHIPAPVLTELDANNRRNIDRATADLRRLNKERSRVGLPPAVAPPATVEDWQDRMREILDDSIGFEVCEWPLASHEDLTSRAAERRRPFNDDGGG